MFINDDLARPAQTVAGVDHGLGERVGLVLVKRQRRRRGKESGKMHIRIAAGDNIFNDATQGGGIQSVSLDTLPDAGDRFEWWRMADLDDGPFVDTKRFPGRSEEQTSELQSLMSNSYAVLCF